MSLNFITDLWRPGAAVGVSLGPYFMRAVRVGRTESGMRVEGVTSVEFPLDRPPHPAEIESALRRAAGELLDEKTRLVTGLRAQDFALHFLELPFDRPDKVRRVLRYEVEPLFLTPVEELVLDYLPLPAPAGQGRTALVFGAKPAAVALAVENFAPAGLDPDAILPDRLGLVRAGQLFFQDRPGNPMRLLIDLDEGQTTLALFDQDRPVMTRSLFYGGRDLTKALAEKCGLDLFEAEKRRRETDLSGTGDSETRTILREAWEPLALEIKRSLAAALQDQNDVVPTIVLTGGGAIAPGADRFLAERIGLEVTFLMDYAADDPSYSGLTPDLTPAFGLALLGLSQGYQPNLRQDDLAPRRTLSRYRVPLSLMAAGLTLTLLLNLGNLFFSYRVQRQNYQAVKSKIERVFRENVPGVTKVVAPVTQLRQELDKARASAAGFNPEGDKVLDLLLEVSRVAGTHEGLRITDLALNPQRLEMQGEGGSFEVIDRLKNQLAGLPYFSEAVLGGARMDPVTRVLTFKISLKRKTG
ncbi:MAG: type II secretion system protein GspL [Thermodesulfobacteriota bacterium]|nr:type II secretion system protein GspL [Thermodesulfobacteriota bacterium]